jgi:hypothetical protein
MLLLRVKLAPETWVSREVQGALDKDKTATPGATSSGERVRASKVMEEVGHRLTGIP